MSHLLLYVPWLVSPWCEERCGKRQWGGFPALYSSNRGQTIGKAVIFMYSSVGIDSWWEFSQSGQGAEFQPLYLRVLLLLIITGCQYPRTISCSAKLYLYFNRPRLMQCWAGDQCQVSALAVCRLVYALGNHTELWKGAESSGCWYSPQVLLEYISL